MNHDPFDPHRPHEPPEQPSWWPEGEAWPPIYSTDLKHALRHGRPPHVPRHKPRWWPAGEPWPPVRPPWHVMRGRFQHRVGFLTRILTLFVMALVALAVASVAGLLPKAQLLGTYLMLVLGAIAVIFGTTLAALVWVTRSLRRSSVPIGDLLEAAGRVSEGDYSVRVNEEAGPEEVRTLAHAFNDMAGRLEQTETQRRTVMADVTHELRTPLSVIQGNLEGMIDGVYPADEANLKSLMDETQMLSRLIEDLRTLALAESGALQLKLEPVDLGALIREAAAAFRAQAAGASVALNADIPAAPLEMNLDPLRVREVLSNLLTNALRHTPRGGSIRVCGSLRESGGKQEAVLTVEDSGSGIAPEDLPFVFDRFYKRDSSGMGLGLSIAKKLVEAHGGTIQAESVPAAGTTIRITLPVAR